MRVDDVIAQLEQSTKEAVTALRQLQAAGLVERKAERGMTGWEEIGIKMGHWLSMYRDAEGLTLKEVSEQCGLSISFISDVEHGRTNPSLESLIKILAVYNLTIEIVHK